MRQYTQFYIDGQWVDPIQPKTLPVIDPATEQAYAEISMGSAEDVDRAVAAAQRASKLGDIPARKNASLCWSAGC